MDVISVAVIPQDAGIQRHGRWQPMHAPVAQTLRRRPEYPPWHWVPASCRDDGLR